MDSHWAAKVEGLGEQDVSRTARRPLQPKYLLSQFSSVQFSHSVVSNSLGLWLGQESSVDAMSSGKVIQWARSWHGLNVSLCRFLNSCKGEIESIRWGNWTIP